MKGISAVIATILMLMITIALAGLAYMYISGVFTARIATAVSLASSDCAGGDIHLLIKNDGTEDLNTNTDITIFVDAAAGAACETVGTTLAAGAVGSCDAITAAAGAHTIRIVGPSNAVTGSIYCVS